jgi:probable HAF family extracellular repeat protein
MQDLGTPTGYLVSGATGVNDFGQVVGYTDGQYQSQYAYYWEDGVWTYLGTLSGPGLEWSVASDINNDGQIAGYSFTLGPGSEHRAWMWEDDVFTDLGDLGGDAASAGTINELGQIVGWAQTGDPGYVTHAFVWEAGIMTDLGTLPGDDGSAAADINEVGQICGSSSHPVPPYFTTSMAVLWEDDTITELGLLPGYVKSTASGINDNGQVIGNLYTSLSGGSTTPFLWEDGVMIDLNSAIPAGSDWILKSASDINNDGQIVCWGQAPNGQYHGCLLTPNPCMMITLTPYMPPIVLPALGGSFDFNVEVSNPGATGSQGDIWCDVILPNGFQVGPTIGPVNLFLSPGFLISRDRIQDVPGSAPAGTYIYHGYVGTYPDYICNEDSFTFEKLETGDGGGVGEWLNTGESFDVPFSKIPDVPPESFTWHQVYPNPFNPATVISYQLSVVSFVNLSVFDVSGRRVTELVDGWRDAGVHEVTFDGSNLASGVYLYQLTADNFTTVGKMMLIK